MPVISPDRHEDLATKLEGLDHAAQLPPDTHPTVIEVCNSPSRLFGFADEQKRIINITDNTRATKRKCRA